mgnify:FL=1
MHILSYRGVQKKPHPGNESVQIEARKLIETVYKASFSKITKLAPDLS